MVRQMKRFNLTEVRSLDTGFAGRNPQRKRLLGIGGSWQAE